MLPYVHQNIPQPCKKDNDPKRRSQLRQQVFTKKYIDRIVYIDWSLASSLFYTYEYTSCTGKRVYVFVLQYQ